MWKLVMPNDADNYESEDMKKMYGGEGVHQVDERTLLSTLPANLVFYVNEGTGEVDSKAYLIELGVDMDRAPDEDEVKVLYVEYDMENGGVPTGNVCKDRGAYLKRSLGEL